MYRGEQIMDFILTCIYRGQAERVTMTRVKGGEGSAVWQCFFLPCWRQNHASL